MRHSRDGGGISCQNNCPPVEVAANGLKGGRLTLANIESSQYVSTLLLCAPYTAKGIELSLEGNIVSAPYIELTISVMNDLQFKIIRTGRHHYLVGTQQIYAGRDYYVEGDASSASYFFLAAALLKKTIRVNGINRFSAQGDIRLLDTSSSSVAGLEGGQTMSRSPGAICGGELTFDLGDMPDMVRPSGCWRHFVKAGQKS